MKKTRKITLIAILAVLVLGILGAGGYLLYNNYLAGQETGNLAGVEWYSEYEREFTISTADELFEFAKLSEFYDFKGQTVKLDADIVINEGNAADWAETVPARRWNPILQFAGTFDGQGHTISGMYAVGHMESLAMFGSTQRGAVIKNFKLLNSFFKNNGDKGTGSILAKGGGTIDTVYSNAIVISTGWHSGGLVGTFTASGSNKITNCWFDGTLTMEMEYGRYSGGILGTVNAIGGKNTVEHCLNSGTITTRATTNPCIGGICGTVMTNGSLQLSDNLNVGNITTERGIYGIGSILGRALGKTTVLVIENNYATSESYYTALGGSEAKTTGVSTRLRTVNLVGYEGYQWTNLDFKKYWTVVEDGTPTLQSFTDHIVDVDGIAKKIDTSWYIEGQKEFVITTAAELFGLAELSRTIDFKGVTIKLGADIVCNEGKVKDWIKEAPLNMWKPIGYNVEHGGKAFYGTFDGQGHTISGLYGKSKHSMVALFGQADGGSVIKNLYIKNSYFEAEISSSSSWGMVGSVVAKGAGTVDTVYSSATLVNSGTVTGGITGMIRITGNDKGECRITNCQFDGEIRANGSTGGILGDVYGCPATVEHCLNTGSISTLKMSGNIGGLVGAVEIQNAKITVRDSLSVGKITDDSKKSWNYGAAIGRVVKTEKTTNIIGDFQNVYVSKEASPKALGNSTGNFVGMEILRISEKDLIGANGYHNTMLQFYSGGKGYWVAQEGKTPMLKSFARGKRLDVGGIRADASWFNKNKDEFTIKNANQLYGIRILSETQEFKGKTIKLANDIVINEGNASTWGETAPRYSWRPIGFNEEFGGKGWEGTFDGQGHTISGLYGKTTKSLMAFIGEVGVKGVVKNLKITNSYFEAEKQKSESWGIVGGVVAKSSGTIDTVYSDAYLVNSGTVTGGIVGMMRITAKTEAPCMIRNCWYDGKITANGTTGGILGTIYGCEANVENCLSTADVKTIKAAGNIGGLVGAVEQNNAALNLTNSLSAGSFKDASGKSWAVGSVLGRAVKTEKTNTKAYFDNVYAAKDIGANTIGNKTGNFSGDELIRLSREDLTGELAYLKTQLGFYVPNVNENGKWVTFADSTPVLKSFANAGALDLTNALYADTSWYDKEPYEISTVAQLYGLAELSKNTDFAGKTITLTAPITLNADAGDASTWGENAPKYTWTPIENFAGTFDGNGNTISGVYLKSGESCLGLFKEVSGTVQNLVLENSYIENTSTSDSISGTGSVVGRLSGTLHTVKSNANVVLNGSAYAGGLVGDVIKEDAKIENSWFAGSVSGLGAHHSLLLGGVHEAGASATIKDCFATGTLDKRANTGGLVGAAWKETKLSIEDSLFAGTFVTIDGVNSWNIGTVTGNVGNGELSMTRVYVQDGSGVGPKVGNKGSNTENGAITLSKKDLTGELSYLKTQLDFYIVSKNETGTWSVFENEIPVLKSFTVADGIDLTNAIRADFSWYEKEPYEIRTVSELYGFAELSKTTDFAGKTITLKKSITLNADAGDASTWGTNEPTYTWTPIEKFAGTFDGGMNTISGIYVKSDETNIGLFKQVTGTVQNLILENSYIENTSTSDKINGTGSVVGNLSGTLDTVKSSAHVVLNGSSYAGGLVGDVTKADAKIENSWFAGSVSGLGAHHGMLLGGLHETGASATIKDCLATGTLDKRANTGGLVGAAWTGTQVLIEDSLFAGTFKNVDVSSWNIGTVTGNVGNGKLSMERVYVKEGSGVGPKVGNKGTNVDTGATNLAASKVVGDAAYVNMDVDFYMKEIDEAGKWFAVNESVPTLTSFADKTNPIDLTKAQGVRTFWHKPTDAADTFILYSAADFRGFQALSEKNTFEGDTVKLGGDIDLNPGWSASERAEDETKIAPNAWEVIAKSGLHDWQYFKGIFDGDMHTISGVYIDSTAQRVGLFGGIDGTLKNFVLSNSYIESSDERVGGVVAVLNGKLDTVKADETVYVVGNNKDSVGGLVGRVQDLTGCSGKASITNCWFAGTVKGTSSHKGGILGQIKKINNGANPEVIISKCLVTGALDKDSNTGGIVGSAWTNTKLSIEDSLFAGTFVNDEASPYNIGTVAGNVGNGQLSMNKVYVKEGSGVGPKVGNKGSNVETGATNLATSKVIGDAAYVNMDLDFYIKDVNENGVWYAVEDKHPILTSFAGDTKTIDLTTAKGSRTFWYQPTDGADEFILYTAAEFRGFQSLSKTITFEGDTVKLGADIELNPGWDAGNPTVGAYAQWKPIGKSSIEGTAFFGGTFDGNMHSISGVYISGAYDRIGLFGFTHGATIKNFVLKNSYIESTNTSGNGRAGSVVGTLIGTLDTVKADETVYVVANGSQRVGGLVGNTDGLNQGGKKIIESTIKNCWFAGTVTGAGDHHGGILGAATQANYGSGTNTTMKDCLMTGSIDYRANAGGIVGTLESDCTLEMSDTLYAGTFKDVGVTPWGNYGVVLGNRNSKTPTMTRVYVQKDAIVSCLMGNNVVTEYTGIQVFEKSQIAGVTACDNMNVDFYKKDVNEEGVWYAVSGSHPVLASFVEKK